MQIPSANLTNAIVGCSRNSTAPTSTDVASESPGILLTIESV